MASSLHPFFPSISKLHKKPHQKLHSFSLPSFTLPLPLPPHRFHCLATTTSVESAKEKKSKGEERGKVVLRARLDHQVPFGDNVALLGSTESLGSWKKLVPMKWTEDGWVCDLQLRAGETVEFKFVILSGEEKRPIWENADNRVLKLPAGGVFDLVCHWDMTDENLGLLSGGDLVEEVAGADASGGIVLEGEPSPFVEQWQGGAASFMRSNEHGSREREVRWDTTELEGVVLRLVEGDRTARNWWRKVHFQAILYLENNHPKAE